MYVDGNGCMVLVLITADSGDTSWYTVHGTTADDPTSEWIATCELSSSKVTLLEKNEETAVGARNDDGSIVWEEGDTWRPLHMSTAQFVFLTRRPYVSMTYVFLMVMKNLFLRAKKIAKKE